MSKKPTNTKPEDKESMANSRSMENKKDPSSSNCKNSATDCGR